MNPSASAVIVVHAGRGAPLAACLERLLDQSLPFDRLILVDNASRDHSTSAAQTLPGVEVVGLDTNLGFAGGVNAGLRRLFTTRATERIALVNNDVELDGDWHAEATRVLSSDHRCGSVATCLLRMNQPSLVDTGGIVWTAQGNADNYLSGQPAPPPRAPPSDIFGACAGAALYRREFFDSVGVFDSSLFAYQEDVDLALRGRDAGWRCLFAPGARGRHAGFGSNRPFPGGGSFADFYNARNTLAVLVQSLPAEEWRRSWPRIAGHECRRALLSLSEGRSAAVLAGQAAGLWQLPSRISRRRGQIRLRAAASGIRERRPSAPGWAEVTVALIVKNAAATLPVALAGVPREAELVVGDGGSDDGSDVLAAAAGAVMVTQDADLLAEAGGNFDVARNQLMKLASRPWVFLLDADEQIPADLRDEVPLLVQTAGATAAFDIPRNNRFWGRSVRLLGEDRQLRLIRRGAGRFVGRALHQAPLIDGAIGHACSPLHHDNIVGWRDVVSRFRRYLPVEARSRPGPASVWDAARAPWRFFHFYYVRQEAWRDGPKGLLVSAIYAAYQSAAEWAAGIKRRA